MERKTVLLALLNKLWKKENVLFDKRVKRVEYQDSRPVVHCTDGSVYGGDIVVGADGVHSVVRNEMWRLSELEKPGSISAADRKCESPSARICEADIVM